MKNQSKCALHGVIPAIVTPMNEDGGINFSLLEKQAAYLLDAGVHGLFACGGTGEGAYLTSAEKKEVFRCLKKMVGTRAFLCLAVINSNTPATLTEMEFLADCDPDFLVATAPYYHGSGQEVILDHYRQVAARAQAPVIVYNIPSATHNPIKLDTVLALSEVDNIIGVKDSSGDFCQFSRGLFGPRSGHFAWIQGEDYLCAPSLLCGGDGLVSGLSNARVEPYVDMYRASEAGDVAKVMECQAKINHLYRVVHAAAPGNGNAAIKAVAELAGRGSRWMRESALALNSTEYANVVKIIEEYEQL